VQPLIEGTAQHRLELLSEALGVLQRRMRLKSLACQPDFYNGVMVRARVLLQDLETNYAWILAAFGCKLS